MKHIFNAETKVGAHEVELDMFEEPDFPCKRSVTCQLGAEKRG